MRKTALAILVGILVLVIAGHVLAAQLKQPERRILHVVIIHGGGTSQRDNDWHLSMVSYLQSNEVLVLLPDKRGSEKSAGDWRTASFEDLATDTLAAVQYL